MFFTKAAIPALAILGLATTVLASPNPITVTDVVVPTIPIDVSVPIDIADGAVSPTLFRRDDLVLSAVQGVVDNVAPLVSNLTKAVSVTDINAAVESIVDLLVNAQVDITGLVGVNVSADVSAIVSASVSLIVELLNALSIKDVLDLPIVTKIDGALSAYLTALTQVQSDIGVTIGKGIPVANLDIFGALKLVLTGQVLDLVQL
ncbi:hypothetical protein EUX98_g8052 [Antrodiella citrinella]|uniref:Uncharacterized protein n=1 Tax=Antrodiella citrinella TaxID=2447956 RepID=A0A4S4MCB2_9APHY|nr:hypothetical protein EUX98_g8052 [Antrodiella citrinella]